MRTVEPNVFSHGMEGTRETLAAWRAGRWQVLRGWFALSLAIALTLLVAATIEVYLWPHILRSMSSYRYSFHTWVIE